jgi:hypothetical protein
MNFTCTESSRFHCVGLGHRGIVYILHTHTHTHHHNEYVL